jgi:plasmid stabilization system protein ParE
VGTRHRRVVWTEAASAALDEAITFVARDSPKNAVILLDRVLDAAESLSDLSARGSVIPEMGEPSIRQLLPSRIA